MPAIIRDARRQETAGLARRMGDSFVLVFRSDYNKSSISAVSHFTSVPTILRAVR